MQRGLHALAWAGILIVIGLSLGGRAEARSQIRDAWIAYYPTSQSDDNVVAATGTACQLCHRDSTGGDPWNAYGWAIRQRRQANDTNEQAFANVEGLDSDGDPGGFTNLQEIVASAQPGWTSGPANTIFFKNGTTATGQSPPAIPALDPGAATTSTTSTSTSTSSTSSSSTSSSTSTSSSVSTTSSSSTTSTTSTSTSSTSSSSTTSTSVPGATSTTSTSTTTSSSSTSTSTSVSTTSSTSTSSTTASSTSSTSTSTSSSSSTTAPSSTTSTTLPGVTLSLEPTADTTLYSESGDVANGAGQRIFAGSTLSATLRRALVRFDVAAEIPAGSVITSASVTMYLSRTTSGAGSVSLHRVLDDWGEGTSDAGAQEGGGATATPGDATWTYRFYDTDLWATPGGDFDPTPSASTVVADDGAFYTWTSSELAAEVQDWVDGAVPEFGWLVLGNEAVAPTSKRFDSRENPVATQRPLLTVHYMPPGGSTTTSVITTSTTTTTTIPALVLEPFVDPLPRPAVAVPQSGEAGGTASYRLAIREVQQQLHRDLPPTTVWGFGDGPTGATYPGPTIEATRDAPVTVTWVNDLRDGTGELRTAHVLPVDTCPHGADDASPRTVVHLHGGHVPAVFDGYPEATFLPGEDATYVYPNGQQAATLWYHDHALGITRLNVYMGLAGFYLVRDADEASLGLPAVEFEVPLVIQDRSFDPDGTLVYPAVWEDHFFGDTILVNGKVWPYLEVTAGKYRFRILNGSTSRTYHLTLSNGADLQVIGTDGGLLPAPVTVGAITVAPGERADVVVDFAALAPGTSLHLVNDAPAPFPGDPGVGVVPDVMEFRVVAGAAHIAPLPTSLATVTPLDEADAVVSRDFELQKASDPCTGQVWLINGLGWDDITEWPQLGTTEVWRFINRSGIMHPMHMHLVFFQVLDRQPFDVVGGVVTPTGAPVPPPDEEAGWKDTVEVGAHEIVRVIAHFTDYKGRYPYHCHILEHEDHEMMRQFETVLCGDGELDAGEACDDGNLLADDGCDGDCAVESGWECSGQPSICGFAPIDIPVSGVKLVVLDKTALHGKAKVVFVAKDGAIVKGTATDPLQVAAVMDVGYGASHGSFAMPAGTRWRVNTERVGKYVGNGSPTTGSVKVGVMKAEKLLKVVAKSLGDLALDVSLPPAAPVYVAELIVNGGEANRHCTYFTECLHKTIAGGAGTKLLCKHGLPDASCGAVSP